MGRPPVHKIRMAGLWVAKPISRIRDHPTMRHAPPAPLTAAPAGRATTSPSLRAPPPSPAQFLGGQPKFEAHTASVARGPDPHTLSLPRSRGGRRLIGLS